MISIHAERKKKRKCRINYQVVWIFFNFLYGGPWSVQLTSGFISFKPQEDEMGGKPTVATKLLNWRRSFSSTLT